MRNFKNLVHRNSIARLKYYKDYYSIGVSFEEYCDYIYKRFYNEEGLFWTCLKGVKIKRINSVSYMQTIEEIFKNEIYRFESSNEDPLIIDCGANIGLSIIYFKTIFPKANIIAFEPDLLIYEACKNNINAFGFFDVELINAAVWKCDGLLSFQSDNSLGGRVTESIGSHICNQVAAVNLKKYFEEGKIIDFLKIDIEGVELDVLTHCMDKLHLVKYMFVEYHSEIDKPQNLQNLLTLISDSGFRYYIKHARDYLQKPFVDYIKDASSIHDLQLNIFAFRS